MDKMVAILTGLFGTWFGPWWKSRQDEKKRRGDQADQQEKRRQEHKPEQESVKLFDSLLTLAVRMRDEGITNDDLLELRKLIINRDGRPVPADESGKVGAELLLLALESGTCWVERLASTKTDPKIIELAVRARSLYDATLAEARGAKMLLPDDEFRRGVRAGAAAATEIYRDVAKSVVDKLMQNVIDSMTEEQALELARIIAKGDLRRCKLYIELRSPDETTAANQPNDTHQ